MKAAHQLSPIGPVARYLLATLIVGELTFAACGRKPPAAEPSLAATPGAQPAQAIATTTTMETTALRTSIGAFERNPTEENQALVKLLFARLDAQIAKLQEGRLQTKGNIRAESTAKLLTLQKDRASEMVRFDRAQDIRAMNTIPPEESNSSPQAERDNLSATEAKSGIETKARRSLARSDQKPGDKIRNPTP